MSVRLAGIYSTAPLRQDRHGLLQQSVEELALVQRPGEHDSRLTKELELAAHALELVGRRAGQLEVRERNHQWQRTGITRRVANRDGARAGAVESR